jgi:tetratricopeptide (TPR) repeat protein
MNGRVATSFAALLVLGLALTGCASKLLPGRAAAARESEHQKVEIRPDAPSEYDLLVAQQLTVEGRTAEAVDAYLRAVEKDPDSAYLHRKAAVALAQHNRIEEALEHGRRAVELDPGDEPSRLFLGQLYRVRRQTGDAERVLTERPGEPRSPDSAFLLYQVYLDAGRYDDALATAEWLARNEPTELRGRMAVAAVYQRMERHAEAEAALREALKSEPGNLRLYGALARMLRQRSAYEEEEALYAEILADYPHHHVTLVALGEAQLAQEDTEGAILTFQRVEERYPDDSQSIVRLGYLMFEERRYEEARQRFERVLEAHPDEYEVAFFLGVVTRRMGDLDAAMAAFESIPPDHRYYPEARAQVASVYERRGDTDEALAEIERALAVRDSRDLRLYGATLRAKVGDLDGAVREVEAMLQDTPEDDELLFNLGVLYGEARQIEQAIAYMQQALDSNPDNASALNYIGYTWAEQGEKLDEAEQMISRAIELRPDDGYIVDSLGWVYYMRAVPLMESGQRREATPYLDRALRELKRANELTGGDPVISEHLGDTYLLMNDKQRALDNFEEAVTLEPRDGEQPKLMEKLENLQKELR